MDQAQQNSHFDPEFIDHVATRLNIGRLKLFENAYRAWFGKEATGNTIEPYYNRYLTDNIVPFWVRNYIRSILNDPQMRKGGLAKRLGKAASIIAPPVIVLLLLAYILVWGK